MKQQKYLCADEKCIIYYHSDILQNTYIIMLFRLLLCIDCFMINLYVSLREFLKFDTRMAEPKFLRNYG